MENNSSWKQKIMEIGCTKWVILVLTGLLLVVSSLPVSSKKEEEVLSVDETEQRYEKSELEAKLQAILQNTEGVGEAEVMLMMEEETTSYLSSEKKVTGVLIAAEGADDYVVVQNIQEAVMALFQIEAHKIKVMKMK